MKSYYDRAFMELAIEAARKCDGGPNDPLVGAVAVSKGKILGIAFRGEIEPGQHAEYTLLEKRLPNRSLASTTIYTTLEPCTKRNSPKLACVERLIARKVRRVVIGMLDPNPLVSGFGATKLREANITIDLFPKDLMSKLEELNRDFIQSIKTDSLRQACREIADLTTRAGTPRQREAIGSVLRECLTSLRKINEGEIRIPGREAGYFKRFLERIEEAEGTEYFKAFIRLNAFEPDELVANSWFENFYSQLEEAVRSNKIVIDYVFLIRTREPSNVEKEFIDRYKKFARRIGTVHPRDSRIPPELLRPSIVLIQGQAAAFTHDRADDSSLLQATEWISKQDYERLKEQYNKIEIMSTQYFLRANRQSDPVTVNATDDRIGQQHPTDAVSLENVASTVANEQPDLGSHASPDGTVTILFSDIVGSAALNNKLGDSVWMEILHEHNQIFRSLLRENKGFEVKTIGDAFMLAFQSARDALIYAIKVQRTISDRNLISTPPIRIHMGLHLGEIIRESNDFFGKHVNFAARIASTASAGQILVSSLLRDVLEPSHEFRFNALRSRKLKGFRGKHRLYSVSWAPPTVTEDT